MELWIFWGSFAAVVLVAGFVIAGVRKRIRRFSRKVFGTADLLTALESMDTVAEETPRSLNGCDSILLPQIRRDFPDFDPNLMKTYARDRLREEFGHKEGFTVHNVVIARYLPTQLNKTVVLQAAVAWRENGRLVQKRFRLHYTYLADTADSSVAANCPNCGGALGYGVVECPFCGSRVASPMGNTWKFTELQED